MSFREILAKPISSLSRYSHLRNEHSQVRIWKQISNVRSFVSATMSDMLPKEALADFFFKPTLLSLCKVTSKFYKSDFIHKCSQRKCVKPHIHNRTETEQKTGKHSIDNNNIHLWWNILWLWDNIQSTVWWYGKVPGSESRNFLDCETTRKLLNLYT